jgi:hypothetical protein
MSPASIQVACMVFLLLVVTTLLVAHFYRAITSRPEGFVTTGGAPVVHIPKAVLQPANLKEVAVGYANQQCTVKPSGYSFVAEGLAAHPDSSAADPKCILVRQGVSLLKNNDPRFCVPEPDQYALNWMNPLNQIDEIGAIADMYPDHVAGLDRCTISFSPQATAQDLHEIDKSLTLAGEDLRTEFPNMLRQFELTTGSLVETSSSLRDTSAHLIAIDTPQMKLDKKAVEKGKEHTDDVEVKLVKLLGVDEVAMKDMRNGFTVKYGHLQKKLLQRIKDRVDRNQGQLNGAVQAQKDHDRDVCEASTAIAVKAAGKVAADAQKVIDDAAKKLVTDALSTCQTNLAAKRSSCTACVDLSACPKKQCAASVAAVADVTPTGDSVIVYERINYHGASSTLGLGSFSMGAMRIGNDTMAAIYIPAGIKVTIYEHENYGGPSLDISSSVPDIGQLGFFWANRVSSIRISKVEASPVYYHYGFKFHWTNGSGGWSTALGEGISTVSAADAKMKLTAIVNPAKPPWSNGYWKNFGYYTAPTSYGGTSSYDFQLTNNSATAREGSWVWLVRVGGPQNISTPPDKW